MVGTSVGSRAESRASAAPPARALVVADANWYTTRHLFAEVRRPGVATLLLHCLDYVNAWRSGRPPWSWRARDRQLGPQLWEHDLVLPSGWMKRFPKLGMRPIRRAIDAWQGEIGRPANLTLVMTYPHYLYLRDQVRPDTQVYFNIDDYTQYWPRCAARIDDLERQAVREADLTVCVSRLRAEQLRASVPGAADRIRHLPHGAPGFAIGTAPQHRPAEPPLDIAHLPRPWLGYVGGLEERVDWALLDRLATAFPSGSIILVGRPAAHPCGAAAEALRRCLARPNVHAIGWRPQQSLGSYNRAFDVCLIPYQAEHPFNRVCCPTKIMDYMGTGRPIVSTDLPECRLYADLFDVAGSHEEFVDRVARVVRCGSDDGRAELRHAWAVEHSCARMVERLLDWLPT